MFSAITTLTTRRTLEVSHTLTVKAGNFLILNGGQVKAGALDLTGDNIAADPTTRLDMRVIGSLLGRGTVSASVCSGNTSMTIQASGGNLILSKGKSLAGFN